MAGCDGKVVGVERDPVAVAAATERVERARLSNVRFAQGDVLPLMERLGATTAADVQPDTLAERMLRDIVASNGIVIGPPLVGAWSHMPA
jgi:tRNA/tmRNA/rRNA uracil-C5-methylase (TrmA/RlmC/RlmD family)